MMDYKSEIQELKRRVDELEAALQLEIGRGVMRDHEKALKMLACKHKRTLTDYEVGSGAKFNEYCADCGLTLKENL
jgi:hypothetical protein